MNALDELRDVAEALDPRLAAAWPRTTRFERHAFGCIRHAYVEARYARAFSITPDALAWAMERVLILDRKAKSQKRSTCW